VQDFSSKTQISTPTPDPLAAFLPSTSVPAPAPVQNATINNLFAFSSTPAPAKSVNLEVESFFPVAASTSSQSSFAFLNTSTQSTGTSDKLRQLFDAPTQPSRATHPINLGSLGSSAPLGSSNSGYLGSQGGLGLLNPTKASGAFDLGGLGLVNPKASSSSGSGAFDFMDTPGGLSTLKGGAAAQGPSPAKKKEDSFSFVSDFMQ
jgi:hypothetical protein